MTTQQQQTMPLPAPEQSPITEQGVKALLAQVIRETEERVLANAVHDTSDLANMMDSARFNQLWRVAQAYARSDIVPEQYRKKPDNCMIACDLAQRTGVHPVAFMQASYVVHGKPGIETKLAIALCNKAKVFKGKIKFELSGKGSARQCTAWAIDADTGDRLEQTVTMEMANAEGWVNKSGSKWKTLPDLMLQYRSAIFLIRLYAPEVLMGLNMVEELNDTFDDAPKLNAPPIGRHEIRARDDNGTSNGHAEDSAEHDPNEGYVPPEEGSREMTDAEKNQIALEEKVDNLYHLIRDAESPAAIAEAEKQLKESGLKAPHYARLRSELDRKRELVAK